MAADQVEGANGATSPSDLRSQILSSIPDDEAEVVEKTADDAEAEDPGETEEAPAEQSEDEDSEPAEDTGEEFVEDPDLAEGTPTDPKTAKGLDAVRKAERRHRERMESDRAELAADKQKHADGLARMSEFEALAKRAKYDPVAVFRALGVNEDDYATVAHALYAESKEGATDPKRKEAAARQLREREKEDKLTATEKRLADLETKLERKEREQAERVEVEQYVSEINAAAKAKLPLAAKLIEKDPESANAGLMAAYERLTKTIKAPKPAQVAAEYDRHERARLTRLGIDPDTIAKAAPAKTAKPGAKPVVNGKPTNGATRLTKEQILAGIPDDAVH